MTTKILALLSAGLAILAAATAGPSSSPFGQGYINTPAGEESLILSPPPPAAGSAALARDEEAQRAALALQGTPRWDLARRDADLFLPTATGTMTCAAGINISAENTPLTHALLRRAAADLGMSTGAIKRHYMRQRPFMVNNQPICTPEAESVLRRDGSYPSGHAAIGYGWGLLLAELLPNRANQLVARGRAFADSRRVCNVHWLSDTEEGRNAGAAVVARLHAIPAFQNDMRAAARELARAASRPGALPDCAAEAAALALTNGTPAP